MSWYSSRVAFTPTAGQTGHDILYYIKPKPSGNTTTNTSPSPRSNVKQRALPKKPPKQPKQQTLKQQKRKQLPQQPQPPRKWPRKDTQTAPKQKRTATTVNKDNFI